MQPSCRPIDNSASIAEPHSVMHRTSHSPPDQPKKAITSADANVVSTMPSPPRSVPRVTHLLRNTDGLCERRRQHRSPTRAGGDGTHFRDDRWSWCVVHEHGVPSTFGVHDEDGSSSGAQGPHASVDVAERQLPNSFLRVPPSFKRTLLSSWLDKSWPYFPSMISFCLFMNQLGILNWVGFWMMVTIRSSSSGLSSPALRHGGSQVSGTFPG